MMLFDTCPMCGDRTVSPAALACQACRLPARPVTLLREMTRDDR